MSLAARLAEAPESPDPQRPKRDIPAGWEPGYVWDGTKGSITTAGLHERPKTWDEFIKDAGLDPEDVEVIEPVQVRGWDAPKAGGSVVRMHYYRLSVRKRNRSAANIDDLLARVKRAKPRKAETTDGGTFVVSLGDLQLGKMDGDGAEGTVDRVVQSIADALDRFRAVRRRTPISTVHIAWLGDCGEGFVSQGGDNAWRTTLTQTEQNRMVRRLMFHTVETFAPHVAQVTQLSVPGNHDQAVRFGKGGLTRYDDSHDVEAMVAVADALAMNPDAYGHVQTHTPGRDELTVTVETSGTIIAHAHGHMMRPGKHWDWWQGHAFNDQPVGRADILHVAHGHHLVVEQRGARTFVMSPAFEQESTWWRHKTGQTGNPGLLTYTTAHGRIGDLHVT